MRITFSLTQTLAFARSQERYHEILSFVRKDAGRVQGDYVDSEMVHAYVLDQGRVWETEGGYYWHNSKGTPCPIGFADMLDCITITTYMDKLVNALNSVHQDEQTGNDMIIYSSRSLNRIKKDLNNLLNTFQW